MNNLMIYDNNSYTIFKEYSLDEIIYHISDMTNDGFKGVICNNNISNQEKFNIFIKVFNSSKLIDPQSAVILYEYMSGLSEEQIDIVSKLSVNDYLFFRYLPTVNLIEKYMGPDNKINKIQGVLKNENISKEERTTIINKIVNNLKIN